MQIQYNILKMFLYQNQFGQSYDSKMFRYVGDFCSVYFLISVE